MKGFKVRIEYIMNCKTRNSTCKLPGHLSSCGVKNNCLQEPLFKACVRYFLSNVYFSPNDSPSKTIKNVFLFHLKSSFRSRDIQVFVFPSSPLFLPNRLIQDKS